ncbi:MAG: hypothetical protein M3458_14310 [Acidobacteriota bacterium]|nr:hypothetical protein [Acidobacteriota bacterium]
MSFNDSREAPQATERSALERLASPRIPSFSTRGATVASGGVSSHAFAPIMLQDAA